ncbi:hypothetical protein [Aurantiacibacter gangjinensis]|uniref:Uncharacterized protein n=1 Tax=Aurantiacibacter gangjinensis TaxID=502682 RepID=A0A0G9MKT8_9SPHN|nr:hypothetical protein [Aurantiacibacter gangjinensis]APE27223.1 hypothetical protein BMF35_a0394 [Aurantiacibacter gangjinensis]KLE31346.1 hypothetical protein AAW01_06980 [Aurantiacibacter gangjinensis]
MDNDTLFLSAIVVVAVLALVNAWRGAVLLRSGDKPGGQKFFVMGLAMLLMAAFAIYIRPV